MAINVKHFLNNVLHVKTLGLTHQDSHAALILSSRNRVSRQRTPGTLHLPKANAMSSEQCCLHQLPHALFIPFLSQVKQK